MILWSCPVHAEVTRATLPNGLRVVVVQDTVAPVVTTLMSYLVGSDDENIEGLAHATEHMMFRGSRSLSEAEFAEVEAVTGGSSNAFTQNNATQYYFTVPADDLDLALRLEASRARDLLNSPPAWATERGAIEMEVTRDNSDASYRLFERMLHHMFAGTPYADPGLGTLQSFGKQVNSPELQAFYGHWYHPNNAVLVIVGDVDPKEAVVKVERYFGDIPSAPLPPRQAVQLPPLTAQTLEDQSDKSYLQAFIAYRFPGYQNSDYAAGEILADVLQSQRGKLQTLVADGKALAADFEVTSFAEAGLAVASLNVPAGTSKDEALTTLQKAIEAYRTEGVPADLVDAARHREVAAEAYRGDSIQSLAFDWSSALAIERRTSPQDDLDDIGRVTVNDVNRVLRLYLDPATATVAFAVPANSGQVVASESRATESHAPRIKMASHLPSWAEARLHDLRLPENFLHPVDMRLDNGLRLIVQPEHATHTVVMSGQILSNPGMQEDPSTEGVATLTEDLLPFGTTTYDRLTWQKELDAIAANVTTGTSFSVTCLSKDLDRGAQLLADVELHPAFRQADFEVARQQLLDEVTGEETAPDHLETVALLEGLYPPDDPERRYATPQTVKGLTLQTVRNWYRRAWRPDLTTLVVVGDITPADARQVVERWFGDWRGAGLRPDVDDPQVPDNPVVSRHVADTGRVQDSMAMEETLKLTRTDADYPTLQLADTVLSEGDISLLYHDLRTVHGYVYSVSSTLRADKHRSSFRIDFGADPVHVDAAAAAARADLASLQSGLLSEDRLLKGKALWLSALPVNAQSYDGVADDLLEAAGLDLPLDQDWRDAAAVLQATPATVQAAARRWLRPNGFVTVVKGP
ncbi:MAG TPA: pitrilysin family protein [Candidatus Xenobia bacterium]